MPKKRITAGLAILPLLASVYCGWPYGSEQEQTAASNDGCPAEARPSDNLRAIDNLYFNEDCASIGSYRINMHDAYWLAESPGFEYYEGHRGGSGDTLEIINWEAGIYLKWAYNRLYAVNVWEGWRGEIAETGIHLGSTLEEFMAAYPAAVPYDCRPFCIGNFNLYALEIYKSSCEEININNPRSFARGVSRGYQLSADFNQYQKIRQLIIISAFYYCKFEREGDYDGREP